MKLRADLFRAIAAECYATAQKVKTLEVRQAYLELTQGWRELADEIERLDRNQPKHLPELHVATERGRQQRDPIVFDEQHVSFRRRLVAQGRRSSTGGR
jgi:hypothetical protein